MESAVSHLQGVPVFREPQHSAPLVDQHQQPSSQQVRQVPNSQVQQDPFPALPSYNGPDPLAEIQVKIKKLGTLLFRVNKIKLGT
jgi:hypothetical protein